MSGPSITLQTLAPLLVALVVASVAAMAYGAGIGDRTLTAGAAAGLIAALIAAALWVNVPVWRAPESFRDDAIGYARRNTRLAALVYAWGAAAMLAVYEWSGLEWRHGWQYGTLMALVAAALILYVRRLGTHPVMPPLWLTMLHAAAATAALVFLVGTNKLATVKGDWAANDVFLYGGIGIVAVCLIAVVTQARLGR